LTKSTHGSRLARPRRRERARRRPLRRGAIGAAGSAAVFSRRVRGRARKARAALTAGARRERSRRSRRRPLTAPRGPAAGRSRRGQPAGDPEAAAAAGSGRRPLLRKSGGGASGGDRVRRGSPRSRPTLAGRRLPLSAGRRSPRRRRTQHGGSVEGGRLASEQQPRRRRRRRHAAVILPILEGPGRDRCLCSEGYETAAKKRGYMRLSCCGFSHHLVPPKILTVIMFFARERHSSCLGLGIWCAASLHQPP
jgi:hypothetical protein